MNLKIKSLYTSIAKLLNIILSFFIQFFTTPFILSSLGTELFGVYVIINKIQGYVSMIDLRPTAILRYKIAATQTENNLIKKREYIGATMIISLLIFPFILLVGWILSICFQLFFQINENHIQIGKYSILILSFLIAIKGFLGIPEAIVRGNNSEYKLFFVESLRLLAYGFFIWLSLDLGYGLIGVMFAIFITAIIDYFLKLLMRMKLYPLFTFIRPKKSIVKDFFNSGSWYMLSSFGNQILNSADIIILGITTSSSLVAIYSLSKMTLIRISESIGNILGSISSSIGHLISDNNFNRLKEIRSLLFRVNLVIGVVLVSYFIIFNSSFVGLWVNSSNFIGNKLNFILCFMAILTLKCHTYEIFINSLSLFKEKSIIIFSINFLFITSAFFFSTSHGISAIVVSLVLSKLVQLILFEILLSKHIKLNFYTLIRDNYKILFLFIITFFLYRLISNSIIDSWMFFLFFSFLFFLLKSIIVFVFILKTEEKNMLLSFIKKKIKNA